MRNPANANDYKKCEELLEKTINSVENSTSNKYKIIVVCNQLPTFPIRERVEYVLVDFPPPGKGSASNLGFSASKYDAGTKRVVGLLYAKKYNPKFCMLLDSDDYISKHLISTIDNIKSKVNGWIIDKGYMYQENTAQINKVESFNQLCGSSNIIRSDLIDLTIPSYNTALTQSYIIESVQSEFFDQVICKHLTVADFFVNINLPLNKFPIRAALWLVGTGENRSGRTINIKSSYLTKKIINEFNIPINRVEYYLQVLKLSVFKINYLLNKVRNKYR